MTEMENKPQNLKYITIHGPGHLDNLDKALIGRLLTFKLITGEVITGRLIALGQYDLVVVDQRTSWAILLMKSAIVSIMGDLSPKQPK
ncbi:MAG: hypothetical protein QXU98_13225 [Candidatus Parvarchaeota archaeon]